MAYLKGFPNSVINKPVLKRHNQFLHPKKCNYSYTLVLNIAKKEHIEEKKNLSVPVIAEITSHQHIQLFKDVKVDEFILTKGIISSKIVQSLFPV
ncbi:hypothetical protein AWH48_16430 [Domibacillus aminovorans]|uniref:Uncharacterized protein n=1 Tax=Domibacillus aminovorans TaxID=29332 RepID=A0A177KZU2_9BACI|nr:hypothetical protein AWH48_16430 [Domibacillus aminovorans]